MAWRVARRCAAALVLLCVCALVALVALGWMAGAVVAGAARGRRLAVAFDQLGNALAGGGEDETFSARCWRCRFRRPYRWLRPAVDALFAALGDAGHCRASHEGELRRARGVLAQAREGGDGRADK